MTLRELLGDGPDDVEITGLAYDNRKVEPGTLFFCVPGFTRDGHDFAPDAVARGAAALVVCRPLGLGVPEVQVEDMRAAMAQAAARFYGDPTAELRVVGITGTSGKTTTAWLVRAMLEAAGMQTGLLGTVTSIVGGEARPVQRTTPEAIDLQRTFREMLDAGDVACAMEISSHALELRRAEGIHCAAAVFTNLSQDHLDFHPDMESYFLAKRRLFETDPGVRIACADDAVRAPAGRGVPRHASRSAIDEEADVRALDVRPDAAGSTSRCAPPTASGRCGSAMPGRFNVLNALGAWAAARALGAAPEPLLATLAEPPRGARAASSRSTRASRSRSSSTTRTSRARSRTCCVSARAVAEGARDRRVRRRRRPRPGQAPADGGDRGAARRPGDRHLRQPALGGPGGDRRGGRGRGARGRSVEREVDRRAAIAPRGRAGARPGDIVVIAGKGHEQGQEFEGGRKEPFDDVDRGARGAAGAPGRAREALERPARRGHGRRGAGARAGRRPRGRRPGARGDRLARGPARRPVLRPARASTSTAARSP